ncbi:Peptidyl-prolyl cis-trans isomerase CWC27 like protein [Eufriesea mexicana]|nr:Peptidyl-prolyl cis-trans isomerase CWC27 like protein [Eufriesea mexicana]
MCRNIYRNLETIKVASIMVLWHIMDLIGPIEPMSNVVMKTTVGDMESELWAKETPKTCRNFIQLCMDGYWDETTFHRIIKGFITQGGDPTSAGEGDKIYAEPFKDEFPTRLRFCQRDLIAMANAGEDANGFQCFSTLISTPDFRNKHTIFGKFTEETICNMLKLGEELVNEDDEPLCPPKLIKTMILNNPLADIIPRIIVQEGEDVKDSSKTETTAVKDFNLLSFIEEAEEDEELNKMYSSKDNSALNHLTDSKLSSQPAVEPSGLANKKRKEGCSSDWESDDEKAMKKRIKDTLRDTKKEPKKEQNYKIDDFEDDKGIKENE